jgi:hypothetical protein
MQATLYPDEVNTPGEKIQYAIDFYGIPADKSNLLRAVIKDVALSLIKRYQLPYDGWIEDIYEDEFMNWNIEEQSK